MIFEKLAFDDLAIAIRDYNTSEDGFRQMLRAIADVQVSRTLRSALLMACFLSNLPPSMEIPIHTDNMAGSFIRKLKHLDDFDAERFGKIALAKGDTPLSE